MVTEKRLVDAHEVEQLFYKQVELGATDLMDAFDDALQDAQTVDAVEVVRCRDCKHWQESVDGITKWCPLMMGKATKADDFCSHGERRCDNEAD